MTGNAPYIVDETEDFAVVCKPPRMHCAPLRPGQDDNTLLNWYAAIFPPLMNISGRKAGEGGLLHRLDYETQGLVLFAKNQHSFDAILTQQAADNFIKEYSAVCYQAPRHNASFPPPPFVFPFSDNYQQGFVVESFFRSFGPGGKQVRPVLSAAAHAAHHGACYRTEIAGVTRLEADNGFAFTVKLRRGFRHQIRCHLAWIGCPIAHDSLYGEKTTDAFLALRAHGLIFTDPQSGAPKEYHIDPLEIQPDPI